MRISAIRLLAPVGLIASLLAGSTAPFPLDSVFSRGDSCLAVEWTPDSANTRADWYVKWGAGCDTGYRHCDFLPGVAYRSIPYSYGGEDPPALFREKLAQGFLAGSHQCHYNALFSQGIEVSTLVAGSDCSGFVCYVWNVPRTNTGGLISSPDYKRIAKSDLQPGDILVRSGYHTVFIVERVDSTEFLIWEETSAVNGCRERSINLADQAWDLYLAVRNPALTGTEAIKASRNNNINPLCDRVAVMPGVTSLLVRFKRSFSGTLTLYDLRGTCLRTNLLTSVSATFLWNLPTRLPRGTYFLSLESTDGFKETFSIIGVR